jgi:hypothetical protein
MRALILDGENGAVVKPREAQSATSYLDPAHLANA